ncbi:MAG: NDP-sugar synthase [Candidatus Cloacimonetes bacterium]|nr:NDP-sugar synthase [Candidatus Cloacimonadota bacterium]
MEPYLLKLVNKPLLEYFLDFASLLKVKQVRIVSDTSSKEIERYFEKGQKWGIDVSYALAHPEDSVKNVYLKNISFCKEDDLIIMNGFFFIEYNRDSLSQRVSFADLGACMDSGKNLYYIPINVNPSSISFCRFDQSIRIRELENVVEYFKLSMDILANQNKHYVLPGYSNEKNAFYGISFIYPHSCQISKPIMIGNNTRFRDHTIIGPNSIIGDNVVIDDHSEVQNSIIYDNTYVGPDLELNQKIIYRNMLISGLTGDYIQISDNVIISYLEQGIMASFFNVLVQRLIALFLILLMAVPWLVLWVPLLIITRKNLTEYIMEKRGRIKKFCDPLSIKRFWLGRVLLHLSLDKFVRLLFAFAGRLYLVGNHLYVNNAINRKLCKDLEVYNPGVFSLIESKQSGEEAIDEFYELEYINNCSTRNNLVILVKTLYRRLVHGF